MSGKMIWDAGEQKSRPQSFRAGTSPLPQERGYAVRPNFRKARREPRPPLPIQCEF